MLLADKRVDVCRAAVRGQNPLVAACVQLMDSIDRFGATDGRNDPARCLVLMLKS